MRWRDQPAAFWAALAGGAILTVVASLSVHVVLLQGLGVPFPDRGAVPAWAALLNTALAVLALVVFYDLARPWLDDRRGWMRWLIVAAVFGMLKEAFRAQIMNGVVTTAWAFSAAHVLSPVIYSVVLGGLVVLVAPRTASVWSKLAAALVVAAVMSFAIRPLIALLLSPLMAFVAPLDHADVYPFPYGWHVLFWAYVTYLEPAIACIVAAALGWPRLAARPVLGMVQFVALVTLVKGALVPTFVFSAFNGAGVLEGMASESQFLLEALVLGLTAVVTWRNAVALMYRTGGKV